MRPIDIKHVLLAADMRHAVAALLLIATLRGLLLPAHPRRRRRRWHGAR
jgi:hypothetical protein